tara:strand:- start:458 stop:925 length:468 start_codon:yes stop_codon:yes gene_type:complete
MPNSCNSITNLLIVLLVCSCSLTPYHQDFKNLKGKLFVNDGNKTLSLNISLQSNLDSDIIQIKKPFYGNVLSVEIDKKDFRITNLNKMNYPQEDIIYLEQITPIILNWFYQCLNSSKQIKIIKENFFKAECKTNRNRTNFKGQIFQWEIFGFIEA